VGAELDGDNPAVSSASEIYFSFTDRSCISLDGKRTVFGRVVSGREVIKAIRQGEDKVLIAKADIPWTSPAL
jgi:cyclophilin family peptidyl-prolyl cis-trans isomerase